MQRINTLIRALVVSQLVPLKQSVWLIVPTITLHFDKLSTGTVCAQTTDVSVDATQ